MDLHVVAPGFNELTRSLGHFDNGHDDPDATVIRLEHDAVAAFFVLIMLPAAVDATMPAVISESRPWGSVARLEWTGGAVHTLVVNHSGAEVAFDHGDHTVTTDAAIAVLQGSGDRFDRHVMTDASALATDGTPLVEIHAGTANVSLAGSDVYMGRDDVVFRLYAPNATAVWHQDQSLPFIRDGDYIESDTTGGPVEPPPAGRVLLDAYPSPFGTATTLVARAAAGGDVTFTIFDARGRRVASIARPNPDGLVRFEWAGVDGTGKPVASGVYFVRAEAAGAAATRKIVLVR
jgi:hypothetical protein